MSGSLCTARLECVNARLAPGMRYATLKVCDRNVYADLGLPDAEKLKIKTGLVVEIRKAMRRLGLTQQEAAKRMGITQPKVSELSLEIRSLTFTL